MPGAGHAATLGRRVDLRAEVAAFFGAEPGFSFLAGAPRKMRADASQDGGASSLYGPSENPRTHAPVARLRLQRCENDARVGVTTTVPYIELDADEYARAMRGAGAGADSGAGAVPMGMRPGSVLIRECSAASSAARAWRTCPWSSSTPASATASFDAVREERLVF